MTETPPREIKVPPNPLPEGNPGPFSPDKENSADIPPPSVGFFKRTLAFFMDLVLIEWITLFFTFIGLSAQEAALGGVGGGIFWEGDQWSLFHSRSWTLVFLGYFTFFGVFGGQTPGKMYFRFQVVMKNGAGVPVLKALIRTLGYFLGFLSLGLGFLAAAVTPSGRALHDFLAGTRVEKRPSS